MAKKSYQYWGIYESGVNATPKGSKKIIEEMAGMLSKPEGTGRKVCIQKGQRGFGALGEATGVCYINGVRQKTRKPRQRKPKPIVAAPAPAPLPAVAPAPAPAPTLAAPELPAPTEPKKSE
jgi:hypothetical protein